MDAFLEENPRPPGGTTAYVDLWMDPVDGAALDATVARHITGVKPKLRYVASKDGGKSGCMWDVSMAWLEQWLTHYQQAGCYKEYVVVELVDWPAYGSSGDAMLEVLTAMRRRGFQVIVHDYAPGTAETFWRVEFSKPGTPLLGTFDCTSLPEAVCRAAINARRAEHLDGDAP